MTWTTILTLAFALSLMACTGAVSVATCDSALQRPEPVEADPVEADEEEPAEEPETR